MAKRRTRGEGSIFESPKGSGDWFAQITLDDGRQVQRKVSSPKEARAKLKELHNLAASTVTALTEKQPTLAQWWPIWLDHFAGNLKPHIREDYRGIGRRYVDDHAIGRRKLIDITFAEVQAWVNSLAKRLKPQTVRNAHARLHKAFEVARRKGYVDRNPADGVELPSMASVELEDRNEINPYTFEQARRLLAALEGNRMRALYALAINLGLRQGELLGLTWDAVDLDRGELKITHQLKRVAPAGAEKGAAKTWMLLPVKTKAGRRTISITNEHVIAVLKAHRTNLYEERLVHGKTFQERDPFRKHGGLVFVTETGAPFHGSDVLQHFHRWAKKAEVPEIRFHDLRHTAATLMLADGRSLPAVSKVLGHATVAITMAIYAHALEDSKSEAVAGLSQRLCG